MTAWQDAGCALCRVKPHSQSRTSSWQLWEQQAGLGSAISLELSLRGARLVLTGRDPARLPELSEALPGSASTVLDLGHPDDGDRLVATVMTAFSHLGAWTCS